MQREGKWWKIYFLGKFILPRAEKNTFTYLVCDSFATFSHATRNERYKKKEFQLRQANERGKHLIQLKQLQVCLKQGVERNCYF